MTSSAEAWPPLGGGVAGDAAEGAPQEPDLQEQIEASWHESGYGYGYDSYAGYGYGDDYSSEDHGNHGWGGSYGSGSYGSSYGSGGNGWKGKGGGKWGKGGYHGGGKSQSWYNPSANDLLGEWLDSRDFAVNVVSGFERRGPLSAKLSRPGGKEQVLSVRRDSASGSWCCGNAVLDRSASTSSVIVWSAYDGRSSTWRRKQDENDEAKDLLPWLLTSLSRGKGAKGKRQSKTEGKAAAADTAAAPRPRRRNWSSMSDGSDVGNVFQGGETVKEKEGAASEETNTASAGKKEAEEEQKEPEKVETCKVKVAFEPDNPAADAARVNALLDARQVLGTASNLQELMSYILIDHDLLRKETEDPLIPSAESPLWERLPEVPRRNVLHRLASFHAGSAASGSILPEFPVGYWTEIHLGRHRFQVSSNDFQVLRRRCTLPENEAASRASAMARVLSLYRSLENPMLPPGCRSSHQLCWLPAQMKKSGIEYELFASPFNAKAENGRYASRFPHVETLFGSAGSYPGVLDIWPKEAVVSVNPPFSDGFLEHVLGKNLDNIVGRFQKVHIFAPVREASWRSHLKRLKGARFTQEFWDATGLADKYLEQPVLHWEGDVSQLD
eukprot:TRINITY_DN15008_c0_g3_i1.p1 TRINITY_DN15008_c0_g3~~TRINITY_DN15008_c0_g3_i1.p1  ORF type:complete len:612 (-),score=138.84 TRINITY_DN15008_c0_g3_i1:289-2124(-)